MPNTKPYFSIVIPSLNEENYLPNLLADLLKQTFFLDKFEVIVVDGFSEDKTKQKALEFQDRLKLRFFSVKKRHVSYQRNLGAKKATGEWILFMDADDRLPPYFLDGIKYQIAKHNSRGVITALVDIQENSAQAQAISRSINLGMLLFNKLKFQGAIGGFIGAHRDVIQAGIAFDEKQKVYEDAFFVQSAIKAGFEFNIFDEPRWHFSLRRYHKEGLLKISASVARLNLRFIAGKITGADFKDVDYGYVMKGGSYYLTQADNRNSVVALNRFLRSASGAQLMKVKALFKKVKDKL